MSINVDAPATEKSTQAPCTYRDCIRRAGDGKVSHDYPCPFCDKGVGHEPIAGTENRSRLIPLNDAELKEVAAGLYMLDCIIADRPEAFHGEDDCGMLYWNSDRSLHAEYERRARTLVDDPFVHPRQALEFARKVGSLGI
jgi:hypothetical protein